jgi:excisionase family DNA binding protein
MEEKLDKVRYREAGRITGLPVSTLYSMVSRRQVPHIRLGPRLVVFSRTELEAWMSTGRVPTKNTPHDE